MKRYLLSISIGLMVAFNASAQSLSEAIQFTESEQFEKAGAAYQALIQREPTNGEVYYNYGETVFRQEFLDSSFKAVDLDSARIIFEKGIQKNPSNPMNYVGKGKVFWYEGKSEDAKKMFYDAVTYISPANKSGNFTPAQKAMVYMRIAECYIKAKNKDLTEANNLLAKAEKEDKNNPEIYILKGDALLEQNTGDASQAITQYKKAYDMDKKSSKALLRIGQLYSRARNLSEAVKNYDEATKQNPGFAPAYREKAEAYYRGRQFDAAVTNYKKYLELNSGSLSARVRYASFLFLSKKYPEAIAEIQEIQKQNSSIPFLYRLMGYSYFETGKFAEGLQSMETFLQKAPEKKVLASDYEYYGKLLSKSGKDSLAVEKLKMAIQKDTSKVELWGELGSCYLKMKKYNEGIEAYNRKIKSGRNVDATDYYKLGIAYFNSKQFGKADTSFLQIITLRPDITTGYLWRANANAQLDPKNEKFLAKPYYEEFLTKVKPEEAEKSKKDIITANEYLAYYYMVQKDYSKSRCLFEKLKELDPNNVKAKKALADPNVAKATCTQ